MLDPEGARLADDWGPPAGRLELEPNGQAAPQRPGVGQSLLAEQGGQQWLVELVAVLGVPAPRQAKTSQRRANASVGRPRLDRWRKRSSPSDWV